MSVKHDAKMKMAVQKKISRKLERENRKLRSKIEKLEASSISTVAVKNKDLVSTRMFHIDKNPHFNLQTKIALMLSHLDHLHTE